MRCPGGLSGEESDFSDNDKVENPIEQNIVISDDGEGDLDMCSKEATCGPTQENKMGIKVVYPPLKQNEVN